MEPQAESKTNKPRVTLWVIVLVLIVAGGFALFKQEREDEASLKNFIEEMALVTDQDRQNENKKTVTLMTLHLSKGLEFPVVFMVGLEEGLFPSRQSFDSLDPTSLEEERRLCYVGMTRAEAKLFMIHARQRFIRGAEEHFPPSRFLKEVSDQYVSRKSSISAPRIFKPTVSNTFPNYETDFESPSNNETTYKKGMRVRHPTFGCGVIYGSEGSGENQRVTVLFQDNSLKKFSVKFARLDRLD